MTAPPQFSLDLAELASPWTPAVAPPSEALQPSFANPSATAIPEFGVYGEAGRIPFTYFGRIPSTGPHRSRFLLVAAIASISAVAFLVLRCFALLRAESSWKKSGSSSRHLSDDDDVFTCSAPPEEVDDSTSREELELEHEASGGFEPVLGVQSGVIQQLKMLVLTRAEAQELTQEELKLVASAQASMRSLMSKFDFHNQRTSKLSMKIRQLKILSEKSAADEEEAEEEEVESRSSISTRLLSLEQELSLEMEELKAIRSRLDTMQFMVKQETMALFIRARLFSSGRSISSAASQALAAQAVVLGTHINLPTELTEEQMNRVGLVVTDLMLKSSTCRHELQRLEQQASQSGHSRETTAAIAAPVVQRARIILSDLRDTASQMCHARMNSRAQEVQREAERMTRMLESGGLVPVRGSPRTAKRLWDRELPFDLDWRSPVQLWRPGTLAGHPWQRSPSAEFFLSSEYSPDESSSSDMLEQLASEFQTTVKLSTSRSVDAVPPRPRQSSPSFQDGGTASWGSQASPSMRPWRSFPEIFTGLLGVPSAETSTAEVSGAGGDAHRGRGPSPEPSEETSEESSEASAEVSIETLWLPGQLPSTAPGRLSSAMQQEKEAESRVRRGIKDMQGWITRSERALEEEVSNYTAYERLKYQMKKGQSIVAAVLRVREEAASSAISSSLLRELRQHLSECEQVLARLQDRLVQRALEVLAASEKSVKDSLMSLEQGMERVAASELNRILFRHVLIGASNTIEKTKSAHETYAKLMQEVPGSSQQLKEPLLRLATVSYQAASTLVMASEQVPLLDNNGEEGQGAAAAAQMMSEVSASGAASQAPGLGAAPGEQLRAASPFRGMDAKYARVETATGAPPPVEDFDEGGVALMAAAAEKASTVLSSLNPQ
ncbi:hypothetical protein, conserved [Eimeria praecox]|uniref:Uncharacterized protein n=1 Tax=Eimeria praecox TaxID=51316 RepID=U6G6X5_9EIME|nr:hypothetical protein, conserved [Eimeria praecox]